MTHSCTGALEMSALLTEVGPGDEVIMPSFTFSSTANAFVLRGAVPVFVDIDPDTLNIDPARVAEAITPATRVVVAVHYGGVGCDMDALGVLARAHGCCSSRTRRRGSAQRSTAARSARSGPRHALVSRDEERLLRRGRRAADQRRALGGARRGPAGEGTNRQRFARGEVDRYTWVDVGSSFLMSDVSAALLAEQLERVEQITAARLEIWGAYHVALESLEQAGVLRRPLIRGGAAQRPPVPDHARRSRVPRHADRSAGGRRNQRVLPLRAAALPRRRRFGRAHGSLAVTDAAADQLIRLPLWVGMTEGDVARVAQGVASAT